MPGRLPAAAEAAAAEEEAAAEVAAEVVEEEVEEEEVEEEVVVVVVAKPSDRHRMKWRRRGHRDQAPSQSCNLDHRIRYPILRLAEEGGEGAGEEEQRPADSLN